MARYKAGTLRPRVCNSVELLGPFPTKRGLSYEFTLREPSPGGGGGSDGRIRILLGMVPVDVDMDNAAAPASMLLGDVVVVRERLSGRPLDKDGQPDPLWRRTLPRVFEDSSFCITRSACTADGTVTSQKLESETLEVMMSEEVQDDQHHHRPSESAGGSGGWAAPRKVGQGGLDLSNDEFFRRLYPGGILVEVPWVISSTVPTRARVSWMMAGGVSEREPPGDVLAAGVDFTPFIEQDVATGMMKVMPSVVTAFYVDNAVALK